jgi:DNA invertase Pin-like site-specific DNA recombinase
MQTPRPKLGVLYLRSSKDRSDASPEAQRHTLTPWAAELGVKIVGEYVDVVESGKDDDRPGFQQLHADLHARGRAWDYILVLDTSRIARRRRIAIVFEELECARRGVKVLYKSMTGIDADTEVLLKSILQGVDEWHSITSRRKAREGMTTNVRRGFRAGGRAPLGYRLEHLDTGTVREGRPVMKSRLALDPDRAPAVQTYLRARATGVRRELARARAGLEISASSLVGVEWNALTYAGTTVWNVHQERDQGRYTGGAKRRPRSEWKIQRDTHPALITEEEAEQLLARLAEWSEKRPRQTSADYLLSGLLKTAAGAAWRGHKNGRYYRAGNRSIPAAVVDATVLDTVRRDLRSILFARIVVERLKASAGREHVTEAARLGQAVDAIAGRISRFMDMADKLETPGPVLRKIDELERERARLQKEIHQLNREAQGARAARAITEDQVFRHLDAVAADIDRYDRERLKDFLTRTLAGITLNPGDDHLQLHWRLSLGRTSGALSWRPHGDATLLHPAELTTYARLRKAA